jgi:octaheme c-type cytochrome (tetrathionate reductase family)
MRIRACTTAAYLAALMLLGVASNSALADSATPETLSRSTADHSKFAALQQDFKSGPEVTRACLTCHTEASRQIHKTQHWKWEYLNPDTKQLLGKKHVINNFCTSALSNLGGCASCHIGYGWKDDTFDFASEENVDCLVCHDSTGKYKKPSGFAGNVVTKDTEFPPGSGRIVRAINLKEIAQSVATTRRETCGACHFSGGGGDGVKHGDLDSSLEAPDKELDVHMDADGNNFRCSVCHQPEGHQVPGSRYAPTAMDKGDARMRGKKGAGNPTTCQACHGRSPHKKIAKLNDHSGTVACQTCHIPAYARGGVPAKLSWDWSTAGKRGPNGKPLVIKNEDGYDTYMGTKGDFVLDENVIPDYVWFNGIVRYTLLGDKIDKSMEPVQINRFEGSAGDGKSMIWPVRVFRGKQVYDPVNETLVVTHLSGTDDSAYWNSLDWVKAVAAGMASIDAPFSGAIDFISTESVWPITHMVAPKEKALGCVDCHASNARLEQISGVYIPGRSRDHAPWLESAGWLLAGLALLGVLVHALGRVIVFYRRK